MNSNQFFRGEDNVEQLDDDQQMLVESFQELQAMARAGKIRYAVVATLDDEGYIGYSMSGYMPNTTCCLKVIGTLDVLKHDLTKRMHRVFVDETSGPASYEPRDGGDDGDAA